MSAEDFDVSYGPHEEVLARLGRKAAGVEDVRLHDLRRTVGSWLAQAGNSLPLIGRVLNHSNPSTTAIYARLGDDPARQALVEHAERITAIAGHWFPTAPLATKLLSSDASPILLMHEETVPSQEANIKSM